MSDRTERWQRYLSDLETLAGNPAPLESQGKLVRVAGLVLEATGIKVPLGSVCRIQMPSSGNAPRRGQALCQLRHGGVEGIADQQHHRAGAYTFPQRQKLLFVDGAAGCLQLQQRLQAARAHVVVGERHGAGQSRFSSTAPTM